MFWRCCCNSILAACMLTLGSLLCLLNVCGFFCLGLQQGFFFGKIDGVIGYHRDGEPVSSAPVTEVEVLAVDLPSGSISKRARQKRGKDGKRANHRSRRSQASMPFCSASRDGNTGAWYVGGGGAVAPTL